MNKILLIDKPQFITSRAFLDRFAKSYLPTKHIKYGISGILDPFASGLLSMGVGSYTRVLSHIDTSSKTYIATLWLGAYSPSLDISNVEHIEIVREFDIKDILKILDSLKGEISYTPPIFSGKKINGVRAYNLARRGESPTLKEEKMYIYDIMLLNYNHPFLSFEVKVSKGGYVRSIGEIIGKHLRIKACLSALRRTKEGELSIDMIDKNISGFKYTEIDVLQAIKYEQLSFINDKDMQSKFANGVKITLKNVKKGKYIAKFDGFFSIIEVLDGGIVKYLLNHIKEQGC